MLLKEQKARAKQQHEEKKKLNLEAEQLSRP